MPGTRIPKTRELTAVALGRCPADLVIQNGVWICVQSGEIVPRTDIAVLGDSIAYVGPNAAHTIGIKTLVIDARGRYLVPGLLDAHMHIESGMLSVSEFVKAVIPHGTTGIFADPHEIGNVLGLRGVKTMVDEAKFQPIHVWMQIPSCVPSVPAFEDPGEEITLEEIENAVQWEEVAGLGELMNFPGVIEGEEILHQEVAATRKVGKVVSGHYASDDLGTQFHAYAAGGAQDDHEGTTTVGAIARVRQGMKSMLRFGSAWHDVREGVKAIIVQGLDSRHFLLCTDDCHPATLLYEGHVNRAVSQAIQYGISPIEAIQMATLNTAEHFHVEADVGQIAPGRLADILLVSDLKNLKPEMVIVNGKIIFDENEIQTETPEFQYPEWCLNSIHMNRAVKPDDFFIKTCQPVIKAHVIEIIENQAPTRHKVITLTPLNNLVLPDIEQDLAIAAVLDRHHGSGKIQLGLVKGFGFKSPCAVGSTVAHDSHQMIVIGTDVDNMVLAANTLFEIQGGQIVVCNQEIIGQVNLPIAGLMSNQPVEIVAAQVSSILQGFRACGCLLNNPNMQLSLMSLIVIPELRLSNLGLFDVNQFSIISLLEPITVEAR
jgi:adenine deaminase